MQITYPKLRRAVMSAALVSASALALVGVPSAPSSATQAPTACTNVAFINGSFETPTLAANSWTNFDESAVPGWETSATDNRLEFWRAPFQGVPVPAGSQFAEINANQRSKLFQDFATTPGETIRWQLQHRGRTGVDVAEVRIGDAAAPVLALQSTLSTGLTWTTYSGLYTVPAGQTTTRLSLDSISSANGNPTYGNFVDDVSVTSGACVVTTKSVADVTGGPETRLGDTLQYSIVATNNGARAATLSSVVDALPVGVSLVPGSITVTTGSSTTTMTDVSGDDLGEYHSGSREVRVRVGSGASSSAGGTLAAGASVTVSFRVVVDSVTALPAVTNSASVRFTDSLSSSARTSTSNTTSTTITPDAPALSIVTSGSVAPAENQAAANVGNTIAWSYVVTNTGNVPLTGVTVNDPEGGTITCAPTTLAVGATANCTGTATRTVTLADLGVGSVANGATASGTPPFGASAITSTESVATIATVVAAPALSIVTSGTVTPVENQSAAAVGNTIAWSYVVTNTGNVPLTSVTVNDPEGGTITCVPTTLEVGETASCTGDATHTVTYDDLGAGSVSNGATASATAPVTGASVIASESIASVTTVTVAPALSIVTSGTVTPVENQAAAAVGNTIAWSYVVANTGNVPLTNVTVNDPEGGTITCVPTSLAVGATANCTGTATRTVTVADLGTGSVSNGATASATAPVTGAAVDASESVASVTTVAVAPALSIVTSGTVTPVENQSAAAVGNTIAWSYVVTNTGNVPLSDVTVNDPEGGTITCVPTTLEVGESATCAGDETHTVTFGDVATGTVSNGATATATPPFGGAAVNATESIATIATVALSPSISVVVDHHNLTVPGTTDPAQAGDQIRAVFIVTNTGNSTLTGVHIIDPVFGSVTCADDTLEPGESTTCEADALYTVTDHDATTGTISRTITAAGLAGVGVASTSVSDEQLVDLDVAFDLPTLPLPDDFDLAATGANIVAPMALALALMALGLGAVTVARLRRTRSAARAR